MCECIVIKYLRQTLHANPGLGIGTEYSTHASVLADFLNLIKKKKKRSENETEISNGSLISSFIEVNAR